MQRPALVMRSENHPTRPQICLTATDSDILPTTVNSVADALADLYMAIGCDIVETVPPSGPPPGNHIPHWRPTAPQGHGN